MREFIYRAIEIVEMTNFPLFAFAALLLLCFLTARAKGVLSRVFAVLLFVGSSATTLTIAILHNEFWLIGLFSSVAAVLALVVVGEKDTTHTNTLHYAAKSARRR